LITISVNGGENKTIVTWVEPHAIDNADAPNVTSNYHSGDVFLPGNTTVTYLATDDAGNTGVCEFVVTILGKGHEGHAVRHVLATLCHISRGM
jgi:hypothetical protein